jgi:hypothetical protein
MVMVVTIGEPEIVVCNCATGRDIEIGAGAMEDGGTAMVIVIVAPCGATVAVGTGTAMLTTGDWLADPPLPSHWDTLGTMASTAAAFRLILEIDFKGIETGTHRKVTLFYTSTAHFALAKNCWWSRGPPILSSNLAILV